MDYQDKLMNVAVAAYTANELAHSAKFAEAMLGDEDVFMFYTFPVHSTPSDDEVCEHFEELLDQWMTEAKLVDVLTDVAMNTLAEL